MKIHIQHRQNILSPEEKVDIEQHAATIFARLSHRINIINISVNDVNGPKGGEDKQCTVVINSHLTNPIVVNDTKADAPLAIRTALQRANRALLRKWKRQQLLSKTADNTTPPSGFDTTGDSSPYGHEHSQ